jgi:purine-nucleoside phosphorylase
VSLTHIVADVAVRSAAQAVQARLGTRAPRLALILGSGLGELTQAIDGAEHIPFSDVPGFPAPGVQGHAGRVVVGSLEGRDVVAIAGRFHVYEGHSVSTAALPVRVMGALGVRTLFVSNVAGGIRRSFRAGDLMLIADHINLMWRNPLNGPVREGELRFPDMSEPYDRELLQLLRDAARDAGIPAVEGVYAALTGPSYETPAEIRMLQRLGAHAVGMSTVPETILARHAGLRVLAVSLMTNMGCGIDDEALSHAHTLAMAQAAGAEAMRLLEAIVAGLEV